MAKLDRLANIATILVAACALVVTGKSVLQGKLKAAPDRPSAEPDTIRVANWSEIQRNGHVLGATHAPIAIVEFGDYECPFCAAAEPLLERFVAHHAGQVRLVYRHWPLRGHKFSRQAARAAECASLQGRFWEMHRALFLNQDSIGLLPFSAFARVARVPDTAGFCAVR